MGGGIYNTGSLTVSGSTISGNRGSSGGGIHHQSGDALTIINSTISGNSADADGGGIRTFFLRPTSIVNSTISGNSAGGRGGGLSNHSGYDIIQFSTITGNAAPTRNGQWCRFVSRNQFYRFLHAPRCTRSNIAGNIHSDVDFTNGALNTVRLDWGTT